MRFLVLILASVLSFAQTTINGGRTVLGPVDNSGSTHTLPMKIVGAVGSLPGSGCTPGELAVVTSAVLGQQIYENSGAGTCVWTQQTGGSGGGGGGISVYTAGLVGFSGTQYFPIGGSTAINSTETNVQTQAPTAATITNLTVQISVAPGMGNQIVFTMRKNAADQTPTCTISGASATSCTDTTHSFNAAATDLLDIKAVTTGSVGTPNLATAFQFGTIGVGTITTGAINRIAVYPSAGTTLSDSGFGLLVGSSTLAFGAIADGTCATLTFTLTGAATGANVAVRRPTTLNSAITLTGWVSATNTITMQACNLSGASVTPSSDTFGVALIQ